MTLLEVSSLQGGYGEIAVLWDISLRVEEKSIVALVGANGAGKTTTLRTIMQLLPALAGTITFAGASLVGVPTHAIVDCGITLVPEGRDLFPFMTVLENLYVGSLPSHARSERAESLKHAFSLFPILKERRSQLAGTLSGGEQQMVAIARGLMSRPRLLMLDEPSLGLAPIVVDGIFRVLQRIRDEGVTILLVEQNVHESLQIADYAYVIENGRVATHGKAADLLADEALQKQYLGLMPE